jgi:hypothetical protein
MPYELVYAPDFSEVRAYITNGLPEDHWFCDISETRNGTQKVWFDAASSDVHEYEKYEDEDVKYSARFRDGLVADRFVYEEFKQDFGNSRFWAEAYKTHSETYFRDLARQNTSNIAPGCPGCPEGKHSIFENTGFCRDAIYQINLMQFHIDFIQGNQPQ